MVTSQCKKIVIFSINRVIIFYIKGNLEAVRNLFQAVQFQTLLSEIWCQLFSQLPKLKRFPFPSFELLVTLAWTPLVALDVAIQVCLLAYTMAFQCTLYLLYVGLFILCHLIGDHSKLEKTGLPQKRIVVKPRSKKKA